MQCAGHTDTQRERERHNQMEPEALLTKQNIHDSGTEKLMFSIESELNITFA